MANSLTSPTATSVATVLKAGPMSMIQDLGRKNVAQLGLSQGGALDEHSFLWANKLLDNQSNDAQIEVNIGGLELQFESTTLIALCGADMDAKLNGTSIVNWSTHLVKAKDILSLRGAKRGVRSYIAIKGGWQLPTIAGYLSSVPREGLGHFLKANMALPYIKLSAHLISSCIRRSVTPSFQNAFATTSNKEPCILHLIPSYQFQQFSDDAINKLCSSVFQISAHSDRMAYRLSGPCISSPQGAFQSEGIALGAVQVPADGQAIVLLKDRQSIGGYPKLGCISQVDLNRLAQLRAGDHIQFKVSSIEIESERYKQFMGFLKNTNQG